MGFLKRHRKIIAYTFAGGTATIVNIVTFTLLTFVYDNDLYEILANAIAILLSIAVIFCIMLTKKCWKFIINVFEGGAGYEKFNNAYGLL